VTQDDVLQSALAGGILLVGIALAWLIVAAARAIIHRITHAEERRLDDVLAQALRRPLALLVLVSSAFLALRTVPALDEHRQTIELTWVAVALVFGVVIAQRLAIALIEWSARSRAPGANWQRRSLPLLRRAVNVTILAIGVLLVLGQLGISIGPLLAGLGLGGLAVALALQPMLSNVFAGSYLLSDESVTVGDFVELDAGPAGWVEDIGWRATRLRDLDNNIVIVPNAVLAETTVRNFTAESEAVDARVECGVAYEEDLDRVRTVALEVLNGIVRDLDEAIADFEPWFYFRAFGDSNITFLMKVRARSRREVYVVADAMVARLHARFRREGIAINYPARRLVLAHGDAVGLDRVRGQSAEPPSQPH
jgi:small-conductance mechanosensitive channel